MITMAGSIHELRATAFRDLNRNFWSKGLPALAGPIRPRVDRVIDHKGRPVDLDKVKVPLRAPNAKSLSPAEWAELKTLIATAKVEPSISADAEYLTGTGVLSLDRPLGGEDDEETGTLLDVIPDDLKPRTSVITIKPYAEMTPEELAACLDFEANRTSQHIGLTPYTQLDQTIADRIEWEQKVAQDGTVQSARFRLTRNGLELFLYPKPATKEEHQRRNAEAVATWLEANRLSEVPSAKAFAALVRQHKAWPQTATASRLASMARSIREAIEELDDSRPDLDVLENTSTYLKPDQDWDTERWPADALIAAHRSPRRSPDFEFWHEEPQDPDEALSTVGIGDYDSAIEVEALLGEPFDDIIDHTEPKPPADRRLVQITGDREWTDVGAIRREIKAHDPHTIICGCARGADRIAGHVVAPQLGIHVIHVPADWDKYGKAAGPIRNTIMADLSYQSQWLGYEVTVLAFHPNLAKSKGTRHMVETCEARQLNVRRIQR